METPQNPNETKSLTPAILRSNGRMWTRKTDQNRFFFPKEWLSFFNELESRNKMKVGDKYPPMTRQQLTSCFLLHTGARINEARNVRIEDLDMQNKRLVLRVTKTKAKKGELKGKPRIIPISDRLITILKRWIAYKQLKSSDYLGILSTPGVKLSMQKAAAKAGIRDFNNFSAHTFRKTLEVWLMALGVQDLKIVAHLGHDIKTAASSYISPDVLTMEEKFLVREILGDLYKRTEVVI